ncbi:MAG: hypothetical protein Q9215_005866 [Flavoplaca cf. flavocitrina]
MARTQQGSEQQPEESHDDGSEPKDRGNLPCTKACSKRRRRRTDGRSLLSNKSARLLGNGIPGRVTEAQKPVPQTLKNDQKIQMAREGFMKRWGKKMKAIGDWRKLAKYTYISLNKSDEPYKELDELF